MMRPDYGASGLTGLSLTVSLSSVTVRSPLLAATRTYGRPF